MYNYIFFTNVLRVLDELNMTKHELSERSGVSISFMSDLTTGKANPSLRVMGAISAALDVPLPLLLESTDLDQESLHRLSGAKPSSSLPPGFVRVSAILPEHLAFVVRKWADQSHDSLQEKMHKAVGKGEGF